MNDVIGKRIDDEDEEMVVNDQDVHRLVIVTQVSLLPNLKLGDKKEEEMVDRGIYHQMLGKLIYL
ncbi:hypothetical protein CK203_115008 [Vitis vinifera]|uniref:Uncharacterized protein n=1 Tax=Vitis vinifera TaxID=29760 RepID=A0A438CYZ6_VITVI|nr:hypothetical protein CK203_115008 [Vitis vinifera]